MSTTTTITTLLYTQADQKISPLSTTLRLKSIPSILPHPPSPLLSLPPELRLQIYTLALHSTPPPPPSPTPFPPPPSHLHPLPLLQTHHPNLALLLVNRQIYSEARLLPFTSNTFLFTESFGSSVYAARKFLGRLEGWQRGAVGRVEVSVVGWRWGGEVGGLCGLVGGGRGRGCVVVVRVGKEAGWEEVGRGGVSAGGDDGAVVCQEENSWMRGVLEKGVKREGVTVEFVWD